MAGFSRLVAALSILTLSAAGAAAESTNGTDSEPRAWRLSATTGFEADRDIFGNTDQNSVPLVLRLEYGRWAFGFAASAIQIEGPATVGGRVVVPSTIDTTAAVFVDQSSFDDWGFGDSLATVSYAWYDPASWLPFVEFTAGLKIPTASAARQHGTGKFDYLLQMDFAKSFGAFTPFAKVGYRLNGSSYQPPRARLRSTGTVFDPAPIAIRDTAETSIGFNYRVPAALFERPSGPAALHMGLMYDWQQNAVAGVSDTHDLVPFISLEWSRNVQIGPYLVIGLSKASPAIGFAGQVTVSY